MIGFETSVRIGRPVDEVFTFVADPLAFPRWNSAVRAVRPTPGGGYEMERALPGGRATNELETVVRDAPREYGIRTTSGPTPFVYRYRFASEPGATVVRLDGSVDLGGAADLVAPRAARAVRRGVDDNFATLKRILEAA